MYLYGLRVNRMISRCVFLYGKGKAGRKKVRELLKLVGQHHHALATAKGSQRMHKEARLARARLADGVLA